MEPQVTMTGRVGHSPELRTTRNGVEFTRFRVAHTPRLQRDGEWEDGETSWVTVLCYRDLAENVCRSVRRGDPVVVTGRIRVETWVDEANHATRESVTIDARAVGHDLSLGSTTFMRVRRDKSEGDQEQTSEQAGGRATPESSAADPGGGEPDAPEGADAGAAPDELVVPASLEGLVEKAPF